jgi:hypothetical protein
MGMLKMAQIILIFTYSSETCKWYGIERKGYLVTCESHPEILAAFVKSALQLESLSIFHLKFLSSLANAFPKLPLCSSTSDGST